MKKQKHILIATPLYPPQIGGPASRTVLLEHKFPEYGYTISVAKFSSILFLPKILRHIAYFFIVFFKAIPVDTIVAQDPVSVGLPSILAAKLLRKKFVLIVVGDYAWEQGSQRSGVIDLLDAFSTEYSKYPFLVRMLKKTQSFVASGADKIIVPSFYLKQIVTNWGVSSEKIVVVYNSFDPPVFDVSRDELRKKLHLKGKVVVSVGRLVPWKGFATLIKKVVPKLIEGHPDLTLYIIGDGPDKSYLEQLIKEHKLSKHVILTGKKSQKDLFEYIKASDIFVLNTSYEGMSHQLLEVMALGVPIVTTTAGGNVEVIQNGENGVLVQYDDADLITSEVLKMLSDSIWSGKLVSQGLKSIHNFSEEKMLSSLAKELS